MHLPNCGLLDYRNISKKEEYVSKDFEHFQIMCDVYVFSAILKNILNILKFSNFSVYSKNYAPKRYIHISLFVLFKKFQNL